MSFRLSHEYFSIFLYPTVLRGRAIEKHNHILVFIWFLFQVDSTCWHILIFCRAPFDTSLRQAWLFHLREEVQLKFTGEHKSVWQVFLIPCLPSLVDISVMYPNSLSPCSVIISRMRKKKENNNQEHLKKLFS